MTSTMSRTDWVPSDDYDDRARWLDDADNGNRWQDYRACRGKDVDPDLFFPSVPVLENGEVIREEEPAYPPPEVKAICDHCPVRGRCLDRNLDTEYGIFGGTTGYQRRLMTKKVTRRRCITCGSTDVVRSQTQRDQVCLACGLSWPVF